MLTDEHIEQIMQLFDSKTDVPYIAVTIDNSQIAANDYSLSVSSYVEAKDTREVIKIAELNTQISDTVKKINSLRLDIDSTIKEIEG